VAFRRGFQRDAPELFSIFAIDAHQRVGGKSDYLFYAGEDCDLQRGISRFIITRFPQNFSGEFVEAYERCAVGAADRNDDGISVHDARTVVAATRSHSFV
jgi:hypothetical protein